MNLIACQIAIVKSIKRLFKIKNFTLFCRKKKQNIEKFFYWKKYTSNDIVNILIQSGVKPGDTIIVHSAYSNLYNYEGTPNELIDTLVNFLGPEGTLCMPAFPHDKRNPNIVFDINKSKSAAGYLSEIFRNRKGVKRSLNQLHSVCALGKYADIITGEHHRSVICFDEYSPFYIIGQLGGYIVNLGMPKWYIGTGEHVCEALLYKNGYFKDKFTKEISFTYIDSQGERIQHTMLTESKVPYVRRKSTKLIDQNFEHFAYKRTKLSNIWITCYDMNYLINRLSELVIQGKTIYKSSKKTI